MPARSVWINKLARLSRARPLVCSYCAPILSTASRPTTRSTSCSCTAGQSPEQSYRHAKHPTFLPRRPPPKAVEFEDDGTKNFTPRLLPSNITRAWTTHFIASKTESHQRKRPEDSWRNRRRQRDPFKKPVLPAHALAFCFLALAILARAAALDAVVALLRLCSVVIALARARPWC